MKKIVYIASGKVGLHRFTYNELVELEKNHVNFSLFLTQLQNGPWMPKSTWDVNVTSLSKAIFPIFLFLFTKSKLIISLFKHAIVKNKISYLLVSLSFYNSIQKNGATKLIHCQIADKKLYIGYYLKMLLDLPLTVTLHSHELFQKNPNGEIIIAELLPYCDKIITISEYNAKIIRELVENNNEKIKIMRLFPTIDNEEKVKGKTKILIVAAWVEKKGFITLFEAISKLERTDFVLWVVGGNPESETSIDLTQLVREYNIEDKIALLGSYGGTILDIIYSASDIFCLPSYTPYYVDGSPETKEGIPVALMEAMAWGKPVISTYHAGIPELVDEILIEERNVAELIESINYLIDHPEKWKEMGKKNKMIIKEKYDKSNVNTIIEIFENISDY